MIEKSPPPISIVDVSKVFTTGLWTKKTAVDHLSLEVPQGEVVGLLGPNGSGKSTTLKMILGFLKPTDGEIRIRSFTPQQKEARSLLGYLPENPKFQKFLSGEDILKYYGGLLGLQGEARQKRIDEMLELVDLKHAAKERVRGYSKGMTQRLAIAQSLLNSPEIVILDEPMSGLDPIGRIEMRELIARVHEELPSTTLFFSTHILADVEQLCSHVALLQKGRLATYCNIQELLSSNEEKYEITVRDLNHELSNKLLGNSKITASGTAVTVEGTGELLELVAEIKKAGGKVVTLSSQRASLERALFKEGQLPTSLPKANEVSQ